MGDSITALGLRWVSQHSHSRWAFHCSYTGGVGGGPRRTVGAPFCKVGGEKLASVLSLQPQEECDLECVVPGGLLHMAGSCISCQSLGWRSKCEKAVETG